ncbi:MAG: helix-turn-helix domain-containing protein [Jatrophihabitantaceae bacterium]
MTTPSPVTVFAAADDQARTSAARFAAEADPSSEFGATVRAVFTELANGDRLLLLRPDRELTPAAAADLLGVTRQFVDRLLADGTLAYRRLPGSSHRRIRVDDVVALAAERDRRRRGAEAIRAALATPDRAE